ncbi:hypothetical protein D9M71_467240 [compost metagenome]
MHHQRLAGAEGRGVGRLDGQHVVGVGRGLGRTFLVVVGILAFVLGRSGQHLLAIGGGGPHLVLGVGGLATPQGHVVPVHFQARLGNRERHAAVGALHGQAVVLQGRVGGVLQGVVVDPLRRRGGAAGRVDVDAEGIRIGLEQLDHSLGQLVLVLLQVGRGDGEQRLVGGERVEAALALLVTGGHFSEAAVPGRDAAVGIAGAFGAQRGQLVLEGLGLLRADRRVGGTDAQGQQGYASQETGFLVVVHVQHLRKCARR